MRVLAIADMEGSFGIWRMRQCRAGTREWQYGRECLTQDVNAVVSGAFDGGATDVTVKDTHETGFNIIRSKLDRRVHYIGGHYVHPTLMGDVSGFGLALYVAIHAASGTPGAFFPHTHYGIFSEVRINGRAVCEMDIYGAYLGEFGLAIGFVSGEAIAVEQAKRALPWVQSVIVDKRKDAYLSGDESMKYLALGREELRKTAAEAVRRAADMKPLKMRGPFHVEAVFRSEELAVRANTWGFSRSGDTVEYHAEDMVDCYDKFNRLTFFPRKIYPYRRPLLFARRQYHRLTSSLFAPAPDSEGAPV